MLAKGPVVHCESTPSFSQQLQHLLPSFFQALFVEIVLADIPYRRPALLGKQGLVTGS